MFIGQALGGAGGMVIGLLLRRRDELRVVLVLGQDRPAHVQRDRRSAPGIACTTSSIGWRKRAGLPQPRCYVIPDASPNAFATGRNPEHAAVAATEGILRMLTDDELEGVLAHELAHVKHRDILISSVAATLAAAIMMISRFAMFFGGSGNGRDDRGGSQPVRAAGDDHSGADCGDADSGGDLPLARVRRRRGRCGDRRRPARAGQRLAKIESAAKRCRSTPTRRRRTCSSSSRSARQGLLGLFSTHPPTERAHPGACYSRDTRVNARSHRLWP